MWWEWLPFVVLFVAVVVLLSSFVVVQQQTVAVIQRFGQFNRLGMPGLNFKIPLIETVAANMSLRVQQLDVRAETKTEDNVFVHVHVAVQYHVIPGKVYEAFYKLADAERQIKAYVFDVVRARVPKIKLDDLFEKKDEIANAVKEELSHVMDEFGYSIERALVTDVEPDPKVKEAMNEINAAQRMRVAAAEKGEAERILKVKAAEAEAQSKALQGKGIADQRRAIIEGLRESVDEFQKSVPGASAQDVMNLVLMTQYFDTLKEIGASSVSSTILIPHSPGALSDLTEQMRTAMITADQVTKATTPPVRLTVERPVAGNGHRDDHAHKEEKSHQAEGEGQAAEGQDHNPG